MNQSTPPSAPPKPESPLHDSVTLLLAHLIAWATIIAHIALTNHRTQLERVGAAMTGIVILLLLALRELDVRNGNKFTRLFMVLYVIGSFLALVFLSEPSSTFTLVWLMVAIFGYLHFGLKGIIVTSVALAVGEVSKYWYFSSNHTLTAREAMFMFISFCIYVVLCVLYVQVQKIYDREHTGLKKTAHQAVIEQKRLNALINNMTESVLVLDPAGTVRLYNAAALGLFDTNANLIGKQPEDFIKLEDEKGRKITTLQLLPEDNKPTSRDDIKLRYSEDDMAALSVTVTPLRTSFGQNDDDTGYIVTMRDITREKSLEEERNEFISVISHELRTPVTVTEASISNSMLINERNGNNEKIAKSLAAAHDQSIFLANMLNDLSTFARAEKGTLDVNLDTFNPASLVSQLASDYRNETEVKGLHITTRVAEGSPAEFTSNRLYVREILQNFVTNAIKYSDKGTITVACEAATGGVRFSITDEGIGISTSDQKKVFDKFFRSEDFRTRSSNGTGLGLYIVKKLSKLLRASFELESEVGKGSTFSITFPDLSDLKERRHTHPSDPVESEAESELNSPSAPAHLLLAKTEETA